MNTRQGGWIASFLIIGAVLMLGLVGTVYFVKTQRLNTDLADVDEGTSQSQAPENDTTTAEKDADEKKSNDSTKADDEKAAIPSEQAPATSEQRSDDTADADDTEALPVTGPAETAVSLFVLSLVAFSVVSYTRSRSA